MNKKTPTPNAEIPVLESENPKKIFRKKSSPNYPNRKRGAKKAHILPAHRAIFQNYKDQGFRSLGKAIRRTGVYSEGMAKRVNILTKSKSWQLLMQEYMPEETIALRHAELLDKRDWRKVEQVDENGVKTTIEVDNGPETLAVSKGLELAYRLRGSFSKEDTPPPSTVMYNLFYKPEVREQMRVFEDGIKQSLLNEINKRNAADLETEKENERNASGEISTDGGGDGGVKGGISRSANLKQ